jgi:hypothetical protein
MKQDYDNYISNKKSAFKCSSSTKINDGFSTNASTKCIFSKNKSTSIESTVNNFRTSLNSLSYKTNSGSFADNTSSNSKIADDSLINEPTTFSKANNDAESDLDRLKYAHYAIMLPFEPMFFSKENNISLIIKNIDNVLYQQSDQENKLSKVFNFKIKEKK